MPEGWIQPMPQASSTSRKTAIDSATRTASARAMAGCEPPAPLQP